MSLTLPQKLERYMRAAGYNPRSLSVAAALGPTAVRDILEGRIASPRYTTLQALARVLKISVADLAASDAANGNNPDAATPPDHIIDRPLTGARDLPVYGAAEGGTTGAMVVSSDPIQWVARPEPLLTVGAAYGVYVVGESMSPAYEQGDIVLVHPSLPPRRNADVILSRRDPDGAQHVLVKRLIGWTEAHWRLRQYNPPSDFDLPREDWTDIQTIVGKYNGR